MELNGTAGLVKAYLYLHMIQGFDLILMCGNQNWPEKQLTREMLQ